MKSAWLGVKENPKENSGREIGFQYGNKLGLFIKGVSIFPCPVSSVFSPCPVSSLPVTSPLDSVGIAFPVWDDDRFMPFSSTNGSDHLFGPRSTTHLY